MSKNNTIAKNNLPRIKKQIFLHRGYSLPLPNGNRVSKVIAHYNYKLRICSCGLSRGVGRGNPLPTPLRSETTRGNRMYFLFPLVVVCISCKNCIQCKMICISCKFRLPPFSDSLSVKPQIARAAALVIAVGIGCSPRLHHLRMLAIFGRGFRAAV